MIGRVQGEAASELPERVAVAVAMLDPLTRNGRGIHFGIMKCGSGIKSS